MYSRTGLMLLKIGIHIMWGLYLAFHILQVTKRGSAKEKGRHAIREEEKARHAMSEKKYYVYKF